MSSKGLIAVTHPPDHSVYLLDRSREPLRAQPIRIPDSTNGLYGVAFDQNDNFWVTECSRNKVFQLSQDGHVHRAIREANGRPFNYPCGVSVSPKRIYICDNHHHRVTVHNQNGVFQHSLTANPAGLEFDPSDVTIGSDGVVYVTDCVNRRVYVWSENGNFERFFKVKYCGRYLAATGDNHLVIASESSQAVMVYNLDSRPVQQGGPGEVKCELVREITEFEKPEEFHPGKFEQPHGICVDNSGKVYVADNNSVLIF